MSPRRTASTPSCHDLAGEEVPLRRGVEAQVGEDLVELDGTGRRRRPEGDTTDRKRESHRQMSTDTHTRGLTRSDPFVKLLE